MKNTLLLTVILLATTVDLLMGDSTNGRKIEWRQLATLPNREGFAGSFSGITDNALLVAGGANFPDGMPWNGGTKKWHDTVWCLRRPEAKWSAIGKLPRPLGYGICVTHQNSVVCVGGSNAAGHYADVFRLEFRSGELVVTPLPSLPITIANGCGAIMGNVLYVAGGQKTPQSRKNLNAAYRLDLSNKSGEWEPLPPWPGSARMLATAAELDGKFWIIGGVELIDAGNAKPTRRYLKDVFRFDPKEGWKQMPDLPYPVAAAPSPALIEDGEIVLLGGDDGEQVSVNPDQHRGFLKRTLRLDQQTGHWVQGEELPFATVTTPAVIWNGAWIVPTGETRPGVRTNQVWMQSARP